MNIWNRPVLNSRTDKQSVKLPELVFAWPVANEMGKRSFIIPGFAWCTSPAASSAC